MPRGRPRKDSGRQERVPLGTPQPKLTLPPRLGYVRRWVNDTPGRIQHALRGGYEHILDEIQEGEEARASYRKEIVGSHQDGSPMLAYAMEIPEKFYRQDQKEKQKPLDEFDKALKAGNIRGADLKDSKAFYVPNEGISVRTD